MLHGCLERVPETVEAAQELLQYGLKGTNLEALLALGSGADSGRWVMEALHQDQVLGSCHAGKHPFVT